MENIADLKVGLFYGSDTGNTEAVTQDLIALWRLSSLEVIEASNMTIEDYDRFDFIILGLSTWYDGDLQSDFEEFFESFKTINFEKKTIALFGLGDQYGYADYFVDALGILGEIVIQNNGKIIGMWPTEGYEFDKSKGLYTKELFYGLALDEDNEMEKTESRINSWIQQLESELCETLSEVSYSIS